MKFVHLHCHSHYSLLEATPQIKELVKKTKALEMTSVALTDHGNLFGATEFYFAAKDAGVHPILGMDAYLAPQGRLVKGENRDAARKPLRRLVLLAQDFEGYQTLCKLSTIGYQEGFYYKPRIDLETLKEHNKNLICLTGSRFGEIAQTLIEEGPEAAHKSAEYLKDIFTDRLYIEITRTGLTELDNINPYLIDLSRTLRIPLVATNDVHYLERDDYLAQEVMSCISNNRTLQDTERSSLGSREFYFKSQDHMAKLFADLPEAIENTAVVASRCDVKFHLKDENDQMIYHLPTFPTSDGRSLKEEIKFQAHKGLEKRFDEHRLRNEPISDDQKKSYFERLEFELSVIEKMGFNGYFLIVQDFIGWAKSHNIPVGPGRGSGAGSLVAYSLGITDLDPIPYNLIFERFLNPERISMPDFDVDFCQDRRHEVIEYVTDKYGRASVSQIITFGKLQAKAAVRDVGRVLGMTFSEVDVIAKLIPEKLGITLQEALDTEARLRELMEEDPKIDSLLQLALKIEGRNRHASVHAAGVIISDRPLVEHAPLYKGEHGENVVQYDMKQSEKIGLIKFDFLGLKTLTLIHNALDLVEQNRGKKIKVSDISLRDPGIYQIMSRGDTAGIFQFEGDGISDLIKKFQPTSFEDITAINALYRPGPMQMLDEYVGRKHGTIPVTYLFEELEPILKETYGIIVYQEQVQLIAARIAKYSLGEADMLRRAMGKKDTAVMEKQKDRFLKGAKENGFEEKKAAELFDLMAKFAQYGFNKSHAAAYCVVAAQTAFLKAYYPTEFYAAMLSTEMSDTDKIVKYVKDARSHKINVRSPHINFSGYKFSVGGEDIFFGLGAIKGVGESAVDAITEARQAQPEKRFSDLDTFFNSVDTRRVNKKVVECLIRAGALDGFGYHRGQLMEHYASWLERAEFEQKDKEVGQASLFSISESFNEQDRYVPPEAKEWTKDEILASEKSVLGFYLTDHPLSGLQVLVRSLGARYVSSFTENDHKTRVRIVGLISSMRELITRKGTRMAFLNLEDLSGQIELVAFPDVFDQNKERLKVDAIVVVEGTVETEGARSKLILDSVIEADNWLKRAKGFHVRLSEDMIDRLEELHNVLAENSGSCPLQIEVDLPQYGYDLKLLSKNPTGLNPDKNWIENLHGKFGNLDFMDIQF
ncbi:MAG: DNA polymerase III subunit alpha [Bdellovibrionales bacterium CG10_big_fil_rev_8_21_14_0_10_45_34]|nr:MAG: DNA polymerase III subunit alpha [Bdellovibrionales bacterium CG10_big_fil_rev_8_21_14_0_10_45_34]